MSKNLFVNLYKRTFEKHGIKMKSYVAVQKKILTIIFALWKKNEAFDNNYKPNNKAIIQEKEQVLTSRFGLKKPKKIAKRNVWLYKVNIQ
jgi:hypothetical protein